MKYIGMVIGGIFSVLGHMFAFMFKNVFIQIRRFAMDPANKNAIWNMQAIGVLMLIILSFLWLVGKYQDLFYGVGHPVFYRAIPLLLACFMGHLIYSCPLFFKSTYAKPIIQTFLNATSIMAAGQIFMKYVPGWKGLAISCILFFGTIIITLYYTLHIKIRATIFSKLTRAAEEADLIAKSINGQKGSVESRKGVSNADLAAAIEEVDLSEKGCLSHLRYYSEECKLELFHTVPTKYKQSELMELGREDRAQHSQTIGGTGAGKTLLATTLVVQDILNDFMGSTILEPKGSFINRLSHFIDRTGRPYRRLDPEYEFTDCLNPFYVPEGEDIEPMIEANVSAFHGYLGPEAEQYFKSRSTQLLRVSIKALKLCKGNNCTYNDLNRLIQPINDDYRAEIMQEFIGRESEVSLLLEYTRNMGNDRTAEFAMKTYSGLYDYLSELTSSKYIQRIFCGPSTFNIDDSLSNGEIVLVNGAYGKLQTLTYTVGRLYLNLLRASTFRRSLKGKVRPHQLTVDELEMFADEEFSTFLEMAREFEVYVNVIHQGNVQLTDVSERLGGMVKQNAVQKFILAGLDNEDAEYYADMIGEEYQIGQSSGTDEMSTTGFKTQLKEEKRYKVLPSEITRLKGYNPKTGEPGECLFRGVRNNIRLEPVIGLVYPLPRKLFEPLESASSQTETDKDVENDEVEEEYSKIEISGQRESVTPNEQEQKSVPIEEKADKKNDSKTEKLDRIKQRAAESKSKEGEDGAQNTIRNTAWDSDNEPDTKSTDPHAARNAKLTDLEERLAKKAEEARGQSSHE
ncbi:type IV secretory system conjugative DNA transfer family protein [Cohnella soli]|uniref:Type IV secretory system conjugative DNA transfer family protein n=1 Tax=Cohnella soli TaxID=425005 RepID=A0ABW0HPK0_9BACL